MPARMAVARERGAGPSLAWLSQLRRDPRPSPTPETGFQMGECGSCLRFSGKLPGEFGRKRASCQNQSDEAALPRADPGDILA